MAPRTRTVGMPPLMVIVGPTASGKSSLAVALAKKYKGEVVSADSRQVYRKLDIGTEKISRRDMRGVPHHGIDIVSPRHAYSVERWRTYAERAIRATVRRGNIPIIAGGTGLYVDALVYGTSFPKVSPDIKLRRVLEKKTPAELYAYLLELDPDRAETIERENPRRLIRAIEVATALGAVPPLKEQEERFDVTWIGLKPPFEVLETRIKARLTQALKRGLVRETRMLRETLGLSWKRIDELGLEYSVVARYLRGELSKAEMEEKLYQGVRRYAKRQLRWLARNKRIVWYTSAEKALARVPIPRQ